MSGIRVRRRSPSPSRRGGPPRAREFAAFRG